MCLMHVDAEANGCCKILAMIGGMFMGVTPLGASSGD